MTADTTQPAGDDRCPTCKTPAACNAHETCIAADLARALPEPQILARNEYGVPIARGYTADTVRALMAERDAARREVAGWRDAHEHYRSLSLEMAEKRDLMRDERDSLAAQVKQLAGAHVAWLDERDALRRDRDLEKKIRKDYVDALEDMRAKLDTARDALEHYQHGGSEYRKIAARALEAIGSPIHPDARDGREPLTINQIREGYEGRPVIERAAFIAGVFHAEKLHGIGPVGTSADGETQHD